jgi:transcriptional regulator with XRE-family HTH domain
MYPNLKLRIFTLGIRQNQMAKELKICESQLSKIINGYREPSEAERALLSRYLDVAEAWLFEQHENVLRPQSILLANTRATNDDRS